MLNKYHLQALAVQGIAIFLIGCIVFAVMWVRTLSQWNRAHAFLSDVAKLKVGDSTFTDAKMIAEKHGGIPWWVNETSMQCTYDNCVFQFVFENKPLTSTHLVPYTGLIGRLAIEHGVVTERHLVYLRYAKRPLSYSVHELVLPLGNSPKAEGMRRRMGFARMKVDAEGIPSAVSIGLSPLTGTEERHRAYSIDVSCLSRIFGCSRPSAIFPSSIPYRGTPYQTHTETW